MEDELKTLKTFLKGSSTNSYLPDFAVILSELGLDKSALDGPNVTIPTRLFRFLIMAQLVAQHFDEQSYLAGNPDVARGIQAGQAESGWSHFVGRGYFEGRSPGGYKIDEAWYRRTYPDVKQAERQGRIKAEGHYTQTGRREGRAASAADERLIAIWKAALSRG